jgi:hypothetical protein
MNFQIRGTMLDAARLPEPLPYYRQVIERCAEWGFNTILLRLADDQGSAVRFASHPELLTHEHAFTPAELRELAGYAAAHGVDLVPELEAFGHTGFITGCPQHAHLRDDHPEGIHHFTGIQPLLPESMTILADLIRETAAIFPSPYLHLGCDEVNWGGSDYSRALIAARGRPAVWTEHLNQLNNFTRQAGKEMMVWADHVLVHEPAILAGLSREVILVDWNYWDSDPHQVAPGAHRSLSIAAAAERALQAGFRLVGGPALTWCRWNLRPGAMQLANIAAYASHYHRLEHPANLGLIVTNWVPSRYLPGAIWDGLAYAAAALAGDERVSSPAFVDAAHPRMPVRPEGAGKLAWLYAEGFGRLIKEHFGTPFTPQWANFFYHLYAEIRPRRGCSGPELAPHQAVLWSSTEELQSLLAAPVPSGAPGLAELLRQAAQLAQSVRRNLPDFQALRLSLALLEHIERRAEPDVLRSAAAAAAGAPLTSQDRAVLAHLAAQDEVLLRDYTQEWDRLRFTGCPSKSALLPTLSAADQPLYALKKAAELSARLIK